MTDTEIIDLFFERSEQAITELAKKHGAAVGRPLSHQAAKPEFQVPLAMSGKI